MKLSNKVYDILKAIALIWLPAIGTLYLPLRVFGISLILRR